MINQKESKQFSMERLLLRDMKTKAINKDRPTINHKK